MKDLFGITTLYFSGFEAKPGEGINFYKRRRNETSKALPGVTQFNLHADNVARQHKEGGGGGSVE